MIVQELIDILNTFNKNLIVRFEDAAFNINRDIIDISIEKNNKSGEEYIMFWGE